MKDIIDDVYDFIDNPTSQLKMEDDINILGTFLANNLIAFSMITTSIDKDDMYNIINVKSKDESISILSELLNDELKDIPNIEQYKIDICNKKLRYLIDLFGNIKQNKDEEEKYGEDDVEDEEEKYGEDDVEDEEERKRKKKIEETERKRKEKKKETERKRKEKIEETERKRKEKIEEKERKRMGEDEKTKKRREDKKAYRERVKEKKAYRERVKEKERQYQEQFDKRQYEQFYKKRQYQEFNQQPFKEPIDAQENKMYQEELINKKDLIDSDQFRCVSPYKKLTATIKERVLSCKQEGNFHKGYPSFWGNKQQCIEYCNKA